MERYSELSRKYPHFIYHDYTYTVTGQKLEGRFTFLIRDDRDQVAFELFTSFSIQYIGGAAAIDTDLEALVFNLGLAEAISYWKLTCAKHFSIQCGHLDDKQQIWWKKLFKKGLSEFFYLNDMMDWDESMLQFESTGDIIEAPSKRAYNHEKVLVPIGGGKDSISSVEILKEHKQIVPLMMNPGQASTDFVNYHDFTEYVKITRSLDRQIIDLNGQGFLNGHIPFSAVLSLYTMTAARLFGISDIALSNESSANEPTILGTDINHQYSKSLEYEQDINRYVADYLDPDIRYFSLLRPLNEYQITKIFSQVDDDVLAIFRSCNRGSKEGVWCCKCPKCLFTYIMVSAHLPLERMVKIFGNDLLADPDLEGYFKSLTGQRTEKPFECVGTIEEVNAALAIIKDKRADQLPLLYQYWDESLVEKTGPELLRSIEEHDLDPYYADLVLKKLADVTSA